MMLKNDDIIMLQLLQGIGPQNWKFWCAEIILYFFLQSQIGNYSIKRMNDRGGGCKK